MNKIIMLNKKIYCTPWDGMIFSIKEEDIPYFDVSKAYHKGDLVKINGEVKVIIDCVQANPSETVMEPVSHFEYVAEFKPETIEIGGKLWMTKNLDYDDGKDGITFNPDTNEYLYTWNAASRIAHKLGWKIPNDKDWNRACEECGGIKDEEENWYTYNGCHLREKLKVKQRELCKNSLGKTILNTKGFFWSSTEGSKDYAHSRDFDGSSVTRCICNRNEQMLVRLVKDI